MARDGKQKDVKPNTGRGKITVVMFQLEGDDATLQDAIQVLGQGMEKLASPAPIYRVVSPQPLANLSNSTTPTVVDGETPGGQDDEDETEETPQQPVKSAQPRKRKPMKALQPVKDIDWENGTPFREYAQQKRPTTNADKLLIATGWFQRVRGEEFVTPSHVMAAFDLVDWDKPEDIGQLFRNVKHDKEWFDNGPKPKQWILAQRGANRLDRLGKADEGADA